MEEIRQTNEKLIRKIEELESNQKSAKVTEEHMQVMHQMIRRYEAENIGLKDEKGSHLR
jgi:Zn-dependent oligopeptidase